MDDIKDIEKNDNIDKNVKIPLTTKQKVIKGLAIGGNCIFYLFIFLLLIFSITQITGSSDDQVNSIFGIGYENVLSNSMVVGTSPYEIVDESRAIVKEDSFSTDDIIWVKKLSNNKKKRELEIGDIITFWDTVSSRPTGYDNGFLNTHRIVDFIYNSKGEITSFVTQGDQFLGTEHEYSYENPEDNTKLTEMVNNGYIQIVTLDAVRAKYIGKWSGAGGFFRWVSDPSKGFIIVIILPTIAFLLFEMFMVIKNIMNIRTQKLVTNASEEKEKMRLELESEKERIKQELLEQLRQGSLKVNDDRKDIDSSYEESEESNNE